MELFEYLEAQIEDHVANPRDDLTTLPARRRDGRRAARPVTTSRGTIGAAADRRASTRRGAPSARRSGTWPRTPADRERLVAEPELLPTAMEELLRAYAPGDDGPPGARGHGFNGCPMKAEDWVLLPFPAANRDPERLRPTPTR